MDGHYHPSPDEDEADLAREIERHTEPEQSRHAPSSTPTFSHSQFHHASGSSVNSSLDHNQLQPSEDTNGQASARSSFTQNGQYDTNSAVNAQQFPRQFFTDMGRSNLFALTPVDPSSTISMRFPSTTQEQPQYYVPHVPGDRSLPSRDVSDKNFDDAYVAFIMYCNPGVDLATDSVELRKVFRSPPRSDGKTFNTFTLFELIRKLDQKELKTWTQLAITLGVEMPVIEKHQSTQKVQQYAVRLKRWMRAMHVDAFFEYCMEKPHLYYAQIPPPDLAISPRPRDGVPPEEDLALRALHPESRPKRGRRKTEDREQDLDEDNSNSKRQHLDTSNDTHDLDGYDNDQSTLFPHSGLSSHLNSEGGHYGDSLDPWTAASAVTPASVSASTSRSTPHNSSAHSIPRNFRFKTHDQAMTPLTPYPQSAITPATGQVDLSFDEPMSAVTPSSSGSKGRSRRRHGPAVSSAWSSGGNSTTGKLRGRPPSNRTVRDGPFSTFPVNPKPRDGFNPDLRTPITASSLSHQTTYPVLPSTSQSPQPNAGKPSGLQLQVPQRVGGVVRLATPTVIVNGESRNGGVPPNTFSEEDPSQPLMPSTPPYADLNRNLTVRLLQADIVPRNSSALGIDEAKQLASSILSHLRSKISDSGSEENGKNLARSLWANLVDILEVTPTQTTVDSIAKFTIRPDRTKQPRNTFDVSWTKTEEGMTEQFSLENMALEGSRPESSGKKKNSNGGSVLDSRLDASATGPGDWKEKVSALQDAVREKEREAESLRARVLSALL